MAFENRVLAFENGVLAFENGVLVFEKGVLVFENRVLGGHRVVATCYEQPVLVMLEQLVVNL